MPKYEPDRWNSDANIRATNNCYDYAADNLVKDRRPPHPGSQPGKGGKKKKPLPPAGPISCKDVKASAAADNVQFKKDGKDVTSDTDCGKDCWVVALVLEPPRGPRHTNDYHWYRKDDSNKWSHKIDGLPATNKDNSGKEITDPKKADRGKYTEFCGYACICRKTVRLAVADFTPADQFVAMILHEPARLVTSGMTLRLPPGELTIAYQRPGERIVRTDNVALISALIHSGRPNPMFEISGRDLSILRDKLQELPPVEVDYQARLGWNGFMIWGAGVEGLPEQAQVHDGQIHVFRDEGLTSYKDTHALEEWLVLKAGEAGLAEDLGPALEADE